MRIVQDNKKLFFFFKQNMTLKKPKFFLNLGLKKIEVYWKKPRVLKKVF